MQTGALKLARVPLKDIASSCRYFASRQCARLGPKASDAGLQQPRALAQAARALLEQGQLLQPCGDMRALRFAQRTHRQAPLLPLRMHAPTLGTASSTGPSGLAMDASSHP